MTKLSAFSICYGSLLGDAYLNSKGIISFRQSMKNKQYIDWLYSHLCEYTTGNGVKYWKQFDTRTQKHIKAVDLAQKLFLKNYILCFILMEKNNYL